MKNSLLRLLVLVLIGLVGCDSGEEEPAEDGDAYNIILEDTATAVPLIYLVAVAPGIMQ